MRQTPDTRTLLEAVSKTLGKTVRSTEHEITVLQGGTLGDVRLVSGTAMTSEGERLPFKVVWKTQTKWERPGDPGSWRREYDLYDSDLETAFAPSLRWAQCFHKEIWDDRIEMWIEYIDGVSGGDLGIETLVQAALELGRLQGKIATKRQDLGGLSCLGDPGFLEREFTQWHTQTYSPEFLVSDRCPIPVFLKEMLRNGDIRLVPGKSFEYACVRSQACDMPEHLRQMIVDLDERKEEAFRAFRTLPIVLCHRDFWIENIFETKDGLRLIDWDTAGWGFLGEDMASLVVDDVDPALIREYYNRLVPAYFLGLGENMEVPPMDKVPMRDMVLVKFGYRMAQDLIFRRKADGTTWGQGALQAIYDMSGDRM